jgi:hypothetical protein
MLDKSISSIWCISSFIKLIIYAINNILMYKQQLQIHSGWPLFLYQEWRFSTCTSSRLQGISIPASSNPIFNFSKISHLAGQ